MKRLIICAGALALANPTTSNAQQASPTAETVDLGEIIVTDGLTPIEQQKSGRAFTVMTGEQLAKNQVRYVADALRQVPGFAVSRTGSYGGFTQVRVRGAEANHLKVLVDGVEVSETSGGEFDFGSLLVDDIDRIEVLRGPQSAFWGSNATAGVVNIITKRGKRDGWHVGARSEAGIDGTFLGGLSISGGAESYDVALSGLIRRNDGFNISDFGDEKDGDRNATLNGKFTVDLSEALTLDGTLRYVNRKSDTDPQDFSSTGFPNYEPLPTYGLVLDAPDWTKTREFFGSLGATHVSMDGALTQKARFTASDTHRDNYASAYDFPGSFDPAYSWDDGSRYKASYQASYQFDTPGFLAAHHQITGGYEWQRETFTPSHNEVLYSREANSVVGEYRGEFYDQFYLNIGARHDFNDQFRDASTYSVSGAWQIPDTETRLHSSVGTGITNPTFYEQFGYSPGYFAGNPNLVPEKSFGWDLGVEQGFFDRALVIDLTYFNQNLTNEIATVYGGPPNYFASPINREGESKRQGVEVAATVNFFNGFTASATYTYTHATEQTTAGGPRLDEVRRPKHSGSLGAAYTFDEDRARVFAEAVFNGRTEDVAFVPSLPPRVMLDAYTVVNIGGSYKFSDRLEGFARVENLFDEKYEEVFGYNTPGRTGFLGVKGGF